VVLNYRLTERDLQVIVEVYKHRYLKSSQIALLLFPSQQTANRRLRVLLKNRYLTAFWAPGIEERIISLGREGANIMQEHLGKSSSIPSTTLPKDYYFLRHFLEVNQFRIFLTQACERNSGIKLLGYIPEYYTLKTQRRGMVKYLKDSVESAEDEKETVSHVPDGVFALEKDGKSSLFFLEIDRGTETISSEEKGVLKTFKFYVNYLLSRGYERYQSDFRCQEFRGFRVLFITSSEERIGNIREAASNLALPAEHQKARRFIWLTEEGAVNADSVFEPIWVSLDTEDSTKHKIG